MHRLQLFCPKSQWLSSPSPSVGITQVWSHNRTYLFEEGDGMGHAHGGSNGAQYK